MVVESAAARVRAGAAVLALNAATRGVRPLRPRLSVTSSHIVLTEPVPDVLEAIGWTGGESITDGRTFVHYFRTTRDGRIAFGWGGGQLAVGRPARRTRRGRRRQAAGDRAPSGRAVPGARRAARSRTPGAARSTSRRATCRRSARSTTAPSTTRSASRATGSAPRTSPAAYGALATGTHRPAWRSTSPCPPVPPEPTLAWLGGVLVRAEVPASRALLAAEGRRRRIPSLARGLRRPPGLWGSTCRR